MTHLALKLHSIFNSVVQKIDVRVWLLCTYIDKVHCFREIREYVSHERISATIKLVPFQSRPNLKLIEKSGRA